VVDEGIGIAAEHLPRLFVGFYRVAGGRCGGRGGTGLGLAIVKHLMRLQGGQVRVESELGRGSRFVLTF
jgi:two-component system phosphate regulon sensor histidine kinase PhoR